MTVHPTDGDGSKIRYPSPAPALKHSKMKPNPKIPKNSVNHWPMAQDNDSSSWDRQSGATTVSWPEELEEVVTKKVLEHWQAIERTMYEEDDQVTSQVLLEECTQWRSQLPHLRIVGKSLGQNVDEKIGDAATTCVKQRGNCVEEEEIIVEHSAPKDEANYSPERQHRDETRKEALGLVLGFVCAELLLDNQDDKTLSKELDTVLRITPAPTYSGRNPLRSQRTANECVSTNEKRHHSSRLQKDEKGDHCDIFENTKSKTGRKVENNQNLPDAGKDALLQENIANVSLGGSMVPISARRQRDFKDITEDGVLIDRDRLYTPQLRRNNLGAVFNERIIVSPVPFVTTTRESFSTLKTTPIGFMGQSFGTSTLQRSARNVNSGFITASARKTGLTRMPQVQSAWQAPVCPTVWPKNLKLAPIDGSRLPSSQNRSLAATPVPPRRSRNSLSPISRDVMPVSPLAVEDSINLGIQGKQIVRQSSRLTLGWDSSPRNSRKIRKKVENSNER